MRILQIVLLVLGLAAFLVAAFTAGSDTGDTFWRVGIACLVLDIVVIMLWPSPRGDTEKAKLFD